MRDPLRQFADAAGETLLAVEPERLAADSRDSMASPSAGIAILPLQGGLTPRGLSFFGRVIVPGMDSFRAAGDRAAGDPSVGAIVLDVNSPGGTFAGTPETAAAVARWAAVKPVIAVVDTLAASAAYFIASQATEIVVTPSGEVGSIGVLAVHMDFSQMMENDGVKATIIRSRAGKADANPYEPLTPEALAAIQASVNEADGEFIKAVAKGRKMGPAAVRSMADAEVARLVSAKRAVELGLADRVATMADVLSAMIKPRASGPRRRSALAFA